MRNLGQCYLNFKIHCGTDLLLYLHIVTARENNAEGPVKLLVRAYQWRGEAEWHLKVGSLGSVNHLCL